MITGTDDHDPPECMITIDRIERSQSNGTRDHDRPERASDNSASERAIRPITLGRRKWTFAGSDAGGKRAAAIYSLIETANTKGLDPEDYLRRVIRTIADHLVNRVADLLPWSLSGTLLRLDQHHRALSLNVKLNFRGRSRAHTIRRGHGREIPVRDMNPLRPALGT